MTQKHPSIRLELYIGVALLLIAVLGFLFMILTSIPSEKQVNQVARPLPEIPRDLFNSDTELNRQIKSLRTPANLPVTVSPGDLGRNNVFENY